MWTIEIRNPSGNMVSFCDTMQTFGYVKALNDEGWFELAIDASQRSINGLLLRDLEPDFLVYFYRDGRLDFVGFVRQWKVENVGIKNDVLTLSGPSQNTLLTRRVVPVTVNNSSGVIEYTNLEGERYVLAAAEMVDLVDNNMVNSLLSESRIAKNFSLADSRAHGAYIFYNPGWENLFDALNELSDKSESEGTPLYFAVEVVGIDRDGLPIMRFMTYDNQIIEHDPPMLFSLEIGNLIDPSITYDYTEEKTVGFAYTNNDEPWHHYKISSLAYNSPWAWNEVAKSASGGASTTQLGGEATELLGDKKKDVFLDAEISPNAVTPYGEWGLGSRVTAQYLGITHECIVNAVKIEVEQNGAEHISARVREI